MVVNPKLQLSCCLVDLTRRQVRRGDNVLTLSTKEAELLAYLASHSGQDIPREELYRQVWGYADGTRSRTLDITVARLRKKIEEEPKRPKHLLTLAGIGYRFELSPQEELRPTRASLELIGRRNEVSELLALLQKRSQLVTLLGPPGIGKRALARHAARLHPGLRTLDHPSPVEVTTAREAHPNSPLLVTQRRVLRLQGEHRFPVPPVHTEDAARLLARAVGTANPSPAEHQQLRQAAESMEGNPQLIVELAQHLRARAESKHWTASLHFVQLPQWLETRVLSWKGSFRAALEDDWSRLEPEARALLCWAAQQPQGFRLEDLRTAKAAGHEAVDLLQDLTESSAVLVEPSGSFLVPLPMRIYALARKADSAMDTTRSKWV
ncbi:MAG TPA: hypothetical protein DIU15_11610 [Deltaproteobacteria bacterium]|nr:hypothetical protein [Deltaproteobacteria bacterium]